MTSKPTLLDYDQSKPFRNAAAKDFITLTTPWEGFTGQLRFVPGFNDLHNLGPHSRGQHGMEIDFAIVGPLGAVSCSLSTNWTPIGLVDENDTGYYGGIVHTGGWKGGTRDLIMAPSGRMVSVHWRTDLGYGIGPDSGCGYLDDAECYGDISYSAADEVMVDFITFGHAKVLEHLKAWYHLTAKSS